MLPPRRRPGIFLSWAASTAFFLQGKNEVILINEGGPELRRVRLNIPHSANPKISPYGESVDDIGERRIVGGEAIERAGLGQLALALFEPCGGGRLAVEGLGLGADDLAAALETDLRGVPNCPVLALSGCDGPIGAPLLL